MTKCASCGRSITEGDEHKCEVINWVYPEGARKEAEAMQAAIPKPESDNTTDDRMNNIVEKIKQKGEYTTDDRIDLLVAEIERQAKRITSLHNVERDCKREIRKFTDERDRALQRVRELRMVRDERDVLLRKKEEDADAYRALSDVYGAYQIEMGAEIKTLTDSYVPQKSYHEMLDALGKAGYGKHGATNTLWGMVMAITKDVPLWVKEKERLNAEIDDLEAGEIDAAKEVKRLADVYAMVCWGNEQLKKKIVDSKRLKDCDFCDDAAKEVKSLEEVQARLDTALVAREREIKKQSEKIIALRASLDTPLDAGERRELEKRDAEIVKLVGESADKYTKITRLEALVKRLREHVISLWASADGDECIDLKEEIKKLEASQLHGMEREGAKKRIEILKERDAQLVTLREQNQGLRGKRDKLEVELKEAKTSVDAWMKEADRRGKLFRDSENLIDDILRKIGLNAGLRYNTVLLDEKLVEIGKAPSKISGLKKEVERQKVQIANQKEMIESIDCVEVVRLKEEVERLTSANYGWMKRNDKLFFRKEKAEEKYRAEKTGWMKRNDKLFFMKEEAEEKYHLEKQDRLKWQQRIEDEKFRRRGVNAKANKMKAKISGCKHATAVAMTEAKREKRKRKVAEKTAMEKKKIIDESGVFIHRMLKELGLEKELLVPEELFKKLGKYGELRDWYIKLVRATERSSSSRSPPPEVALERIIAWREIVRGWLF